MNINVASWWGKFRGSKWFLIILISFVVCWMTLRAIFSHFDPDMGMINLILSVEASISFALFAMLGARFDEGMEEMVKRMEKKIDAVFQHVDEIHEEVVEDEQKENT